jgi:hypothetical protein
MDNDLELGPYKEDAVRVAGVRSLGACCWVFLGLLAFTILVSYIPVSGITEAPAYARTLLYMSLGYHFDDVQQALASVSPPPPAF